MSKKNLVKKSLKFINSKAGQQALKKAFEKAEEQIKYLQEARKVDPESLHRPITI